MVGKTRTESMPPGSLFSPWREAGKETSLCIALYVQRNALCLLQFCFDMPKDSQDNDVNLYAVVVR